MRTYKARRQLKADLIVVPGQNVTGGVWPDDRPAVDVIIQAVTGHQSCLASY